MANVKEVVITGYIPFDAGGNVNLINFLGQMNLPTYGLRIIYDGDGKYVDNAFGGRTFFAHFIVRGREAVRVEWLERFVYLVEEVKGKIIIGKAKDVEQDNAIVWHKEATV